MELKKHLIGHTYKSKTLTCAINEENIDKLKEVGADVFEAKKPRRKKEDKFKGIVEDDNSNTEGAE